MQTPAPPSNNSHVPPRIYSPLAGLLSYLVPGLGQLAQGRVSKGLLFLVCLYGLFFYGMYLGDWKNVYLPEAGANNKPLSFPGVVANIYNRPQFAGQFWIGVAAWPAIWQYNHMPVPAADANPFWHDFERTPPERVLNELQTQGDKTWDLGWVFTVIAGVLNILVIYDATAGPALGWNEPQVRAPRQEAVPA
jgi:hypothetical protein